ncbi:hypothetical protein C477_00125 [Haloterrigena salina JCM 13891]|uniref:Uncharacterized protein n=1 Tax=Haloterrigena salina JCM 13891 TaxID=1227488 RepID=M0CMW8_9EURY|nr:hypothetical protein C477_00125 [Haloterrigena salina JCM 13891]
MLVAVSLRVDYGRRSVAWYVPTSRQYGDRAGWSPRQAPSISHRQVRSMLEWSESALYHSEQNGLLADDRLVRSI